MKEKGCTEDKVIECVKKAMELAQYFYTQVLDGKIDNIRFEGFDTTDEKVYTVDLSFVYPTSDDELGRILGKTQRIYKRFAFGKCTMKLVSMSDV